MKLDTLEIEQRYVVRKDRTKGILLYDMDNQYPQRIGEIIDASGIASRCVWILEKFTMGAGFADVTFNKALAGGKVTVSKLLRECIKDYSRWRGFAVVVNYNALLQPVERLHMPFEFVRFTTEDNLEHSAQLCVYDDWGKTKRSSVKKEMFKYYDYFNPDPEIVLKQIERAGGIEKWNGQIFYYSADGAGRYPKSSLDPERETAVTDAEIKDFHYNNITTNFMASHIMWISNELQDEDFEALLEKLRGFQGAKKASRIAVFDNVGAQMNNVKLDKLEIANNDKLFEGTQNNTRDRIRVLYGIPPVLLALLTAGKLGTAQEIKDAITYYNMITGDDRAVFTESFQEIFSPTPELNPSGNYSINPITDFQTTPV